MCLDEVTHDIADTGGCSDSVFSILRGQKRLNLHKIDFDQLILPNQSILEV